MISNINKKKEPKKMDGKDNFSDVNYCASPTKSNKSAYRRSMSCNNQVYSSNINLLNKLIVMIKVG